MAKSAKTKIDEMIDALKPILEALRDQPRNAWMVSSSADQALNKLNQINEVEPDDGTD